MTSHQLREHGMTAAAVAERCRAGGPWQRILPGVHLLHPGPATGEERLHAALLYTASRVPAHGASAHEASAHEGDAAEAAGARRAEAERPYGPAMITGLAALALHGFAAAPPAHSVDRVDVLVPRTPRLRAVGYVRYVRSRILPEPVDLAGVPTAPVARALADAIARLTDAAAVRRLLTESVRAGHCEATAVVRELRKARLLARPHVVDAVDALLAAGRAVAEGQLYEMVRTHNLPEPLWNVDLRLPDGPRLGGVDAYWPQHAVALEIDTRAPLPGEETVWDSCAQRREYLERLGVTVVHVTPRKLRDTPSQQAAVVRTALVAAADREQADHVIVLPR